MQNRLKSKASWVAIFTLIVFVLKTYFKIEIPQVDTLIELIFVVAIALGIFNNPENPASY